MVQSISGDSQQILFMLIFKCSKNMKIIQIIPVLWKIIDV